jgi:hypothetical protein
VKTDHLAPNLLTYPLLLLLFLFPGPCVSALEPGARSLHVFDLRIKRLAGPNRRVVSRPAEPPLMHKIEELAG